MEIIKKYANKNVKESLELAKINLATKNQADDLRNQIETTVRAMTQELDQNYDEYTGSSYLNYNGQHIIISKNTDKLLKYYKATLDKVKSEKINLNEYRKYTIKEWYNYNPDEIRNKMLQVRFDSLPALNLLYKVFSGRRYEFRGEFDPKALNVYVTDTQNHELYVHKVVATTNTRKRILNPKYEKYYLESKYSE